MKNRMLLSAAAALITASIAVSCSSLPFPDSPEESLFVLAADIDREYAGGEQKVSKVILTAERVPDESELEQEAEEGEEPRAKTFSIAFKPGDEFGTAALEPGEYIITRIDVYTFFSENTEEMQVDEYIEYYPFFIEKRVVRLYEKILVLQADPPDQGGYTVTFSSFIEEEKKLNVFNALRNEPRWPGWERYQLVGFPEEALEE